MSRVCLAVIVSVPVFAAGASAQELDLVAPGARVEQLADGFGFVERPAADPDGTLYFSDIPNGRIHRWTPAQDVTTFRDQSGGANGLRFDLDGNLVVCEMGNRRVTVIDPRGGTTVLAERFEDHRFNSPNDPVGRSEGGHLLQ